MSHLHDVIDTYHHGLQAASRYLPLLEKTLGQGNYDFFLGDD